MRFSRLSLLAFFVLCSLPVLAQDNFAPAPSPTYTENRLSALDDQMRNLNGKMEQLEFSLRRLEQNLQRMQSDSDARLTKLEQNQATPQPVIIPQPVATPQPPQQQPQQQPIPLSLNNGSPNSGQGTGQASQPVDVNGTLGALKLQDGRVTGAVNNPKAPALPNVPADYGLTPQEQYNRAFDFLRQADYPNAETAFKNFIDKNPKDKLIDNAKYWYGETLYVRARFDEAAVAFADAYQQNTNGSKAPDSLLKLGLSLSALNKTPDACVTLGELKTKYPNAAAALKARAAQERARLKCPAR